MGHVGLTPQTATALGGYRAQGRTAERALDVARDALALQEAGCFSIVFEAIPAAVAELIMARMEIPVIGIGAGTGDRRPGAGVPRPAGDPRGARRPLRQALRRRARRDGRGRRRVRREVRDRTYPAPEHGYSIDDGGARALPRRPSPSTPACAHGAPRLHGRAPDIPLHPGRHGLPGPGVRPEGSASTSTSFAEAGARTSFCTAVDAARSTDARALPRQRAARRARSSRASTRATRHPRHHQRLNQTFVTPIDREDILELGSALDDIVDYTEEVADYLGLYKIEAPMEQAQRLAGVLKEASSEIPEAMPSVRGFRDIRRYTARSTGSRTRAIASAATRSPRCSTTASTRWS